MEQHAIRHSYDFPNHCHCLLALQNMGVEFLHGVENFHQGEVLSVQAACNFVRPAEKMHFMQLFVRIFFRYLYKDFQKKNQ